MTESLQQFKKHSQDADFRAAYQGLLDFLRDTARAWEREQSDWTIKPLYQGEFTISFIAVVSPGLADHGLKALLVFRYDCFRFQAWLTGRNRALQESAWNALKHHQWKDATLLQPSKDQPTILRTDLADGLELDQPARLQSKLKQGLFGFIQKIETELGPPANAAP